MISRPNSDRHYGLTGRYRTSRFLAQPNPIFEFDLPEETSRMRDSWPISFSDTASRGPQNDSLSREPRGALCLSKTANPTNGGNTIPFSLTQGAPRARGLPPLIPAFYPPRLARNLILFRERNAALPYAPIRMMSSAYR